MTFPYGLLAQSPELARLLMLGHGQVPPLGLVSSTPQPQSQLATPFPNQSPIAPTPQPGIFDRIQNNLFPEPQGLQGLLSPDDSKAARRQGLLALAASLLESGGPVVGAPAPSLGQAIGRGIPRGQEAFQASIANALGAAQYRQQQQDAILRKQDEAAKRTELQRQSKIQADADRILATHPPLPADATPQQVLQHQGDLADKLLRAGAVAQAASVYQAAHLSALSAKELAPPPAKPDLPIYKTLPGAGGTDVYYSDGSPKGHIPYTPLPKEPSAASAIQKGRAEDTMSRQYEQQTAKMAQDVDAYSGLKATLDDPRNWNTPKGLEAITALAAVVQPKAGLGVRLGNIQIEKNAQSLAAKLDNFVQQAKGGKGGGQIIPRELAQSYLEEAQGIIAARAKRYQEYRKATRDVAERRGMDPDNITRDQYIADYLDELMRGVTPTAGVPKATKGRALLDSLFKKPK